MAKKLPKKIYVVMGEDHGDHFLIADSDIKEMGGYDGETVGIYELTGEKKVKVEVNAE